MKNEGKHSWWKRILEKYLFKSEPKMLVSGLDREVEEIVNMLNDNGMKPYASCDGSIKTHMSENTEMLHDVTTGYIAMLDSSKIRDLFAILQEDETYKLTIDSKEEMILYGNKLQGLTFGIYFDNLRSGKVEELTSILKAYLTGEIKPTTEQRRRIDRIAELVSLNKDENLEISYCIHEIFKLYGDKPVGENYGVQMRQYQLKKDMRPLKMRQLEIGEQNLHITLDEVRYRSDNFEQSMKVLAGMGELYMTLPDIDPDKVQSAIQEQYVSEYERQRNGTENIMYAETREFWQEMHDNAQNYIQTIRQTRINKSIARHKRKVEKQENAAKKKDTGSMEF